MEVVHAIEQAASIVGAVGAVAGGPPFGNEPGPATAESQHERLTRWSVLIGFANLIVLIAWILRQIEAKSA